MGALSLGYKTLIAWMVDLASRLFERYPESPDPLSEPAVVLVDEIDLHLHPQWQRILMRYLGERFPNTQFIVTAHSPLIVQSAPEANIVVLRREGDHVVIDNDVDAIRGWRVDQILTSDLFNLTSARPPQFDALLEERTRLLSKARLTKKDQRRLEQLETETGPPCPRERPRPSRRPSRSSRASPRSSRRRRNDSRPQAPPAPHRAAHQGARSPASVRERVRQRPARLRQWHEVLHLRFRHLRSSERQGHASSGAAGQVRVL